MTAKAFDLEIDKLNSNDKRVAFYYGFARHSPTILRTVAFIRGIKTDFWSAFFCDESGEVELMANHHLIDIIVWLARCDGFPLLSFEGLSDEYRRQLMNPPTDSPPIIFDTREAAPKPQETILRCRINWLASDREIEEAFNRHISSIRPEDFKKRNTTKAPDRGTVGFGPHRFPFRFASALNWLRKFEQKSSKSWRTVFKDRNQVEGKAMADQKRQWQRDVQKAARILEWFETGSELRASDFRK